MKNFLKLFFSVAFFIMGSVSASAATYYVDTSGNDSNSGTSIDSPWKTIQKAANTMTAGDTAKINAGNYAERVSTVRSGTTSAKIFFRQMVLL